jgi:hypothetical protein
MIRFCREPDQEFLQSCFPYKYVPTYDVKHGLFSRVAVFSRYLQHTKTENIYYNGYKIHQNKMYPNIFHSKALQNKRILGFFGYAKYTIWQPCSKDPLQNSTSKGAMFNTNT